MTITCIIPAYNEEKTIGNILDVVKEVEIIDEIIVVSDGSIDKTVDVALSKGVKVVDLKENRGKGGAMKAGLEESEGEIILFLDADLIGLTPYHIKNLIEPVKSGRVPMSLGVFTNGRKTTDLAQKFAPYLSGQRAIKRELLNSMSDLEVSRFGVELALTRLVEKENINIEIVPLPDMSHVMKEEKLGFVKGFMARLKMYWEIVNYLFKNPS
ncbi:glycosyltransferase family 2 protein [Anaerobranca gottschalkii]|uniref:Glucosyl-3-phosphoglycerate synthase n=1 Tax=Anaerobranca gottschalkii DSM 13577 TaxID=1120990 RepID=A0A1H9Z9Q6_9FIRM|nr:glycosyltransferase family 2 protein [Anaerobranca gottschalkii]SES78258.1 Glycosyl transferase family 2 [Anaerobranca gottschalkii DSM 13577]